jgi:hypothetical protein
MSVVPATKTLRGEGIDLEPQGHNLEETAATDRGEPDSSPSSWVL